MSNILISARDIKTVTDILYQFAIQGEKVSIVRKGGFWFGTIWSK